MAIVILNYNKKLVTLSNKMGGFSMQIKDGSNRRKSFQNKFQLAKVIFFFNKSNGKVDLLIKEHYGN